MCKASFLYSMELSELERVPQPSRLAEKSSSRRILPVLVRTVVALGNGPVVGGSEVTIVVVDTGVSVARLRKGIFRKLAPMIARPATEKRRQATPRQPMIQPAGIPVLDGPGFAGAGLF